VREFASDIAFTPAVKAIQEQKGARESYARMERGRGWRTVATPELEDFLSGLDMFYLGTSNLEGQPYIQYRGGPAGFLKVIDTHTLCFADFGGNSQYITLGNLSENPKAFIFLMDYVNSRRVKLWGTAKVIEDDQELLTKMSDPTYPAKPQRAITFRVEAWDVNCSQHIHERFSAQQVANVVEQLQERVRALETELAEARKGISHPAYNPAGGG
jgi:uncharacterized protein